MYFNEEHKKIVEERGDGYTYIGSYKFKEVTIDGKKSNPHIRVKCPYCGKEYDIRLSHFKRGDKCNSCCNEYENSFAYYIQQELKEPLNKYWDWEKNDLNPYCISKQTHNFVSLKCDKINYHNNYNITPHNFVNGSRCSYCHGDKVHPKDSFAQWGIDTFGKDFLKKYWNWDKNNELGVDPWKIKPNYNKNKVWIYCQEKDYHNDDGGYLITLNSFVNGSRCSYCKPHQGKIHSKDSFGALYPEKSKYWSENNNISPFKVAPRSSKKYKFICEKCGREFERSLNKLNRTNTGVVCRECNSSQLEIKTKYILEKYNINYNIQVEYNGLLGLKNGNLSYDFYLPNYNLLIECQGEQHERFVKGFHRTKKDFKKQLEHDRRKHEYAKQNNIDLLEIWYYDIDNIEEILINELNLK